MIVAVVGVRVVQVPCHQVVDMVPVRDRGVAAARSVRVLRRVPGAGVRGRARGGVVRVHRDDALVDVPVVGAVKVPVVCVVDVAVVRDGLVAARGAVDVLVISMGRVLAHGISYRSWWLGSSLA